MLHGRTIHLQWVSLLEMKPAFEIDASLLLYCWQLDYYQTFK
jgi:hypothetical protein